MDLIVRKARENDIDSMVGLLRELFEVEEDFVFDEEKQRRGLSLIIGRSRDCVLVCVYQERVIGMCSLQTLVSTAEGGSVGLLEDVVVCGKHRGKGIGRMLVEQMELWAVQHGLSRLQLLADQKNGPALAFYERLGWKQTQLVGLRKVPGQVLTGNAWY